MRGARAWTPVSSDCRWAAAANSSSADRCCPRPACNMPVAKCRSTAGAGSTCSPATFQARRSQRSPSSNSPPRPPCRQPPQALSRGRAGPPSRNVQPAPPPVDRARSPARPRQLSTGTLDAPGTRPPGRVGRSPGQARRPPRDAVRRRRVAQTTFRRSRDSAARLPGAHCPSRSRPRSATEAPSRLTCSITSVN